MTELKKCPKCPTLVSDPKANYCKRHAAKNPIISKEYERNLVAWVAKRFPGTVRENGKVTL